MIKQELSEQGMNGQGADTRAMGRPDGGPQGGLAPRQARRPYHAPVLTRLGALRVDTAGTATVLTLLDAGYSYKS